MSLATSNRDGGRTNEAGHLRAVTKGFIGQVLSGLNVTQRGAGANMSVDVAVGDAIIQRSDGTYGHPAWNDAVYNRTLAAADGSNPRRDIIVMYIDYGQAPSTGVANNTNGVVKIISVPGTAAGSPVDPSNATIQAAVGSGNPFVKLARVRVAAGATSISNSVIDDLRLMATSLPQGGWVYDSVYAWVYASATSFSIAGVDVTSQFPVGTRIAIYQGGSLKYFAVTASTYSGGNTTVTVDGGGTYTLTNVSIDRPAYSYFPRPSGYPYTAISDPLAWWQELARQTLTGTQIDMSVSFPVRKYLMIMVRQALTGGTASGRLRFNGDAGANYQTKYSVDNGAYTNSASDPAGFITSTTQASTLFAIVEILNVANSEKLLRGRTVLNATQGAANPVIDTSSVGKWANAVSAITSVATNVRASGTGSLAAGSELIVLGHD